MAIDSTTVISDLPPSAKLVFYVLERHASLSQQEIHTESLLAIRTVRHALTRLDECGLIDQQSSTVDARLQIYSLSKRGDAIAQQQ